MATHEASPTFIMRDRDLAPSIEIRDVNFAYGTGESRKQVLFENNLTVYPGEIVIMTGPSGSGKTTLLTLIGALRSVQEGAISVLGRELKGLDPKGLQEVRKEIGFIFQAHNLFESLTAQQTLALAMELHRFPADEYANRPRKILSELGLDDRMHYRPENLSGGQRQRVAIGRALINHPRLILADEPTAALDKDTGRTVVDILKKRAKEEKCTIIIVTHDNRILDVADRIVNMIDGYVVSNVVVEDSITIANFLTKCPVFKDTSPTLLAEVANDMTLETYNAGDVIIRQGDTGDRFYLVRSGTVRVYKETVDGDQHLTDLGSGDFFGELALLKDEPRAATVEASEPVEVFSLPKAKFDDAIRNSSSLVEQLKKAYFK